MIITGLDIGLLYILSTINNTVLGVLQLNDGVLIVCFFLYRDEIVFYV